jgi:hypothetical protein
MFYVSQPRGPFSVYFGPRVGYTRLDTSREFFDGSKDELSTNGWFAAAALGGEIAVIPRASLGIEGAIVFSGASGTESNSSPDGSTCDADVSTSGTSTHLSVALRLYPWGDR